MSNKLPSDCGNYPDNWEDEKEYEVWSEGYAENGSRGTACFHGKFKGKNFDETMQKMPHDLFQKNNGKWYVWGCRLFDNEIDARKSFG